MELVERYGGRAVEHLIYVQINASTKIRQSHDDVNSVIIMA